ncbi:MAG: DUF2281 domain-containing protein [Chloroflexi bacterium]|nr:DUF2281 domain-containing protein [Chloroflexota bacterium]MBI3742358.1 DUF2281 domain-containing protein [Chloroflexota bacterium]
MSLQEMIQVLPPELQNQVRDFVARLLDERQKKPRRKPRFLWAGALKELNTEYTSVQLQHQIGEWRSGTQ